MPSVPRLWASVVGFATALLELYFYVLKVSRLALKTLPLRCPHVATHGEGTFPIAALFSRDLARRQFVLRVRDASYIFRFYCLPFGYV